MTHQSTRSNNRSQDDLVEHYHRALPQRVRAWLHQRLISEEVITTAKLGWTGKALSIPIFDQNRKFTFFKFRKDPDNQDPATPKYWSQPGARAELYGWEHLVYPSEKVVVICEGELDRLCLEGQGIAAVTSTGGAGVFREEWCKAFQEISEVYVCFDNDTAGWKGARRVAQLIPHAKIADVPPKLGPGSDITDFFVRLRKHKEDFLKLLAEAHLPPKERLEALNTQQRNSARHTDAAVSEIKGRIPIEHVVSQYLSLRRSGRTYTGRCILHDDRVPSLAVYPDTQSFYCFGCGIGGDAICFLMEAEHLTFREALNLLAHYAGTP
ncbi:MAG: CHC2 zinc finger domain-containing protein [bacterium]|nr:CHC2 zinc finger domain-containing protein [bacterium]